MTVNDQDSCIVPMTLPSASFAEPMSLPPVPATLDIPLENETTRRGTCYQLLFTLPLESIVGHV